MSNYELIIRNYECGRKNDRLKKGFTLIELLVSIAIFVIFMGVISLSYIGIVRSQRQANEVRAMYSDVRNFIESLSQDMRLGTIDYDCYQDVTNTVSPSTPGSVKVSSNQCEFSGANRGTLPNASPYLAIVNKDQTQKVVYWFDKDFNELKIIRYENQNSAANNSHADIAGGWLVDAAYASGQDVLDPNTDGINVFSGLVKVTNVVFSVNPPVNPYLSANYAKNQYQFQPKVTMTISIANADNNVVPFHLNFQTTLSSRVYSRSNS